MSRDQINQKVRLSSTRSYRKVVKRPKKMVKIDALRTIRAIRNPSNGFSVKSMEVKEDLTCAMPK